MDVVSLLCGEALEPCMSFVYVVVCVCVWGLWPLSSFYAYVYVPGVVLQSQKCQGLSFVVVQLFSKFFVLSFFLSVHVSRLLLCSDVYTCPLYIYQ